MCLHGVLNKVFFILNKAASWLLAPPHARERARSLRLGLMPGPLEPDHLPPRDADAPMATNGFLRGRRRTGSFPVRARGSADTWARGRPSESRDCRAEAQSSWWLINDGDKRWRLCSDLHFSQSSRRAWLLFVFYFSKWDLIPAKSFRTAHVGGGLSLTTTWLDAAVFGGVVADSLWPAPTADGRRPGRPGGPEGGAPSWGGPSCPSECFSFRLEQILLYVHS